MKFSTSLTTNFTSKSLHFNSVAALLSGQSKVSLSSPLSFTLTWRHTGIKEVCQLLKCSTQPTFSSSSDWLISERGPEWAPTQVKTPRKTSRWSKKTRTLAFKSTLCLCGTWKKGSWWAKWRVRTKSPSSVWRWTSSGSSLCRLPWSISLMSTPLSFSSPLTCLGRISQSSDRISLPSRSRRTKTEPSWLTVTPGILGQLQCMMPLMWILWERSLQVKEVLEQCLSTQKELFWLHAQLEARSFESLNFHHLRKSRLSDEALKKLQCSAYSSP